MTSEAPAAAHAGRRRSNATQRRSQEERRAETRRKLIDAAIQVLGEEGYANLTITKTARRAGLTNGALQHHFPTRDDLMLALMDAVYPVLDIPFRSIAAEGLGVRERVDRVIDRLWEIYSRPEYLAIWDIALGSRGDRRLWVRLRAYQREVSARMRDEFAELFADLGLSTEEVERIFQLSVSHLRGLALQSVFGPDPLRRDTLELAKQVAYEQLTRRAGGSPSSTSR